MGRLLRVDTSDGTIDEILPRTPWIRQIYGGLTLGSAVRIAGGGFPTELAGIRVEGLGGSFPVVDVSPHEIWIRMPADYVHTYQLLRISVPSDSPLQLPDVVLSSSWKFVESPAHEDGSPITVGNPLRPGEVFTLLASGFRDPPGPCRIETFPSYLILPLEVLRIGPAPQRQGLTAIAARAPEDFPAADIRRIVCNTTVFGEQTYLLVPVAGR